MAVAAHRPRRRCAGLAAGRGDGVRRPRLPERGRGRCAEHDHEPRRFHRNGPAGAVLISVLTTTFLGTLANDPAVPKEMSSQAQVQLSAGIPFVSDANLNATLEKAGVPPSTAQAIVEDNVSSRINGLRAALAVLAFFALLGLVMTRRLPTRQPKAATPDADSPPVAA